MKRLARPVARFRTQLRAALKPTELARYASTVTAAFDLATEYNRRSPRLDRLRSRVRHPPTRKFFIDLYGGRRIAVRAIKDSVRAGLDDVTAARCQYCGFPGTDSLDHYLHKARFPELSVFARNLIPACLPCNTKRAPTFDTRGDRQILHFYDDDIDAMPDVLIASVNFAPAGHPVLTFSVGASSNPLVAVYRRHFAALKLAKRYALESRGRLHRMHVEFGRTRRLSRTAVATRLLDQARSEVAVYGRNNFEAAMYRALAASPAAVDWLRS